VGGFLTVGGTFNLSGGTLAGGGTVAVDGTLNWTGGTMMDAGYTLIQAGATLNISDTQTPNVSLNRRTINNVGTTNWTAGTIVSSNGAIFNNEAGATFNATSLTDTGLLWQYANFENAGMFTDQNLRGYTQMAYGGAIFNNTNTGMVHLESGGMNLEQGMSQGSFLLEDGTTLEHGCTGYTLANGTIVSGPGMFFLEQFNCTTSTLTVTGSVSIENAKVLGGILNGSGTLEVTNTLTWTGGTIADAAGALNLDATSTLNISANAGKALDGRTVNLYGTATWSGGTLTFLNGAVFNVQPGATFAIQAANYHLAGNGSLINQGSLMGLDSTGSTILDGGIAVRNQNGGSVSGMSSGLEIDNFGQSGDTSYTGVASGASLTIAGNVTMGQGILAVDGTLTVTGNLTLQGGALLVGSGTVTVNGGTGTLENMAGIISPGGDFAAGTLTVRGNFINDAQGIVNIDIGGTNPGSGYDQLSVSGRITLNGGTANVTVLDSYAFTDGDTFNVLVSPAGTLTGDFATYNVFNLDPNYQLTHAVNGGSLVLTVSALGDSPETGRVRSGGNLLAEAALAVALADDFPVAVSRHDGRASAAGV
jgi:hypothetical protein